MHYLLCAAQNTKLIVPSESVQRGESFDLAISMDAAYKKGHSQSAAIAASPREPEVQAPDQVSC